MDVRRGTGSVVAGTVEGRAQGGRWNSRRDRAGGLGRVAVAGGWGGGAVARRGRGAVRCGRASGVYGSRAAVRSCVRGTGRA